ncbi:MAG: hypothetical protein EI684_08425 [Candidatus Viridilinea halotolerans]|uniref:Uncharacterized protein n=1 Tax=Candidatus Viridilinea halotolerans TaxID=2491704 RepID=A0A426U281_9CHLR|nr:MAG: hypothetical protein EI684_08425 [Candidatus Viridilinea halotolerans]
MVEPLDFKDLKQQRCTIRREQLCILGGTVAVSDLATWLAAWDWQSLEWQMVEWVHRFALQPSTAQLADLDLLERLRAFGSGGDLELRRDGPLLRWRFVGAPATPRPAHLDGSDYWQGQPADATLQRIPRQAVLWGAWDARLKRWYDDRVGAAQLNYPPAFAGTERIYAHYWEYLDGGQPAFVWMHALSATPREEMDHV